MSDLEEIFEMVKEKFKDEKEFEYEIRDVRSLQYAQHTPELDEMASEIAYTIESAVIVPCFDKTGKYIGVLWFTAFHPGTYNKGKFSHPSLGSPRQE